MSVGTGSEGGAILREAAALTRVLYYDGAGRLRDDEGRFARVEPDEPPPGAGLGSTDWFLKPDEVCPNGCVRFGDWWCAEDCPTHLVLGAIR